MIENLEDLGTLIINNMKTYYIDLWALKFVSDLFKNDPLVINTIQQNIDIFYNETSKNSKLYLSAVDTLKTVDILRHN